MNTDVFLDLKAVDTNILHAIDTSAHANHYVFGEPHATVAVNHPPYGICLDHHADRLTHKHINVCTHMSPHSMLLTPRQPDDISLQC